MRNITLGGVKAAITAIALFGMTVAFPLQMRVGAAATDSLYTYSFAGTSGSLQNLATTNTTVPMNLSGSWTSTATGVQFTGNTSSAQSVGYAKPVTGNTIDIAATQAVGASVIFTYKAPQNSGCFADSQNISQIGFFATNTAQVKLQLSNCSKSATSVFPQCRIAGASTPSTVLPVTSTVALVDGQTYRLQCVKAPDPTTGNTSITLKTARILTTTPHQETTNTFSVAKTGRVRSTSYLTAANKYPLPAQNLNTDQFVGEIQKLSYCKGATTLAAQQCLEQEVPLPPIQQQSAAEEVKYSYGSSADQVVFSWHGGENTIFYGTTPSYGMQATAQLSTITPTDMAGPFYEVTLSSLLPDTTYYYKIGTVGPVSSFKTVSTGNFTWVDVGDTESTYSAPYLSGVHQLIADQLPNFVTHGGDISYMNYYGLPAIHSYYTDQEVWSRNAAFQPVWGNHEYGAASATAPVGTPRDSLANYKGRGYITNPQTVPNDTLTKTSNPGCGGDQGSTHNTCMGEDWGWFKNGKVLFISYPEPWFDALADWRVKADALMAQAQQDNSIDFIVTYGHRPAYTSSSEGPNLEVRGVLEQLAQTYSPRTDNPNGKYVLSVGHHAHSQEAFAPINGLTHITNASGGTEFTNFTSIDPNSVYRLKHIAILVGTYDATNASLEIKLVCGPNSPAGTDVCQQGSTMYSTTFTKTPQQPQPAALVASLADNATQVQQGGTVTYVVQVTNVGDQPVAAGSFDIVLPVGAAVVDAADGTVNGDSIQWNGIDVAPSQVVTKQVVVAIDQQAPVGAQLTANMFVSTALDACQQSTSICSASESFVVAAPAPLSTQWIVNQSIESDDTGWLGRYGSSPLISVGRSTEAAHSGSASIKVLGLAGASGLNSGFSDSPRWLTSTVAGKAYTGSVWVKPGVVGQTLNLRLREWRGSTLVTDQKVAYVATSTEWQNISTSLTALENGNQVAFIVYGSGMSAGSYFYADDMSLISVN